MIQQPHLQGTAPSDGSFPSAQPSTSASSTSIPIRLALLQNLTTQSLLLSQVFSNLANPTPAPSAPSAPNQNAPTPTIPQLRAALAISTADLAGLVREAHGHQVAWKELQRKKSQVQELENRVRGLIGRLERGRAELEGLVRGGREVVGRLDKGEKNPIPAPTLLSHAQSLARHSSAPLSHLSSTITPADKMLSQPWPTEVNMRQGLLFQLQGSMSGVGDTGVVGREIPTAQEEENVPVHEHHTHEEPGRRYDPNAVFQLELNSDDSDDD